MQGFLERLAGIVAVVATWRAYSPEQLVVGVATAIVANCRADALRQAAQVSQARDSAQDDDLRERLDEWLIDIERRCGALP